MKYRCPDVSVCTDRRLEAVSWVTHSTLAWPPLASSHSDLDFNIFRPSANLCVMP